MFTKHTNKVRHSIARVTRGCMPLFYSFNFQHVYQFSINFRSPNPPTIQRLCCSFDIFGNFMSSFIASPSSGGLSCQQQHFHSSRREISLQQSTGLLASNAASHTSWLAGTPWRLRGQPLLELHLHCCAPNPSKLANRLLSLSLPYCFTDRSLDPFARLFWRCPPFDYIGGGTLADTISSNGRLQRTAAVGWNPPGGCHQSRSRSNEVT